MSIHAEAYITQLLPKLGDVGEVRRDILLAIATMMDETGVAQGSITRLMAQTGWKRSAIITNLKKLYATTHHGKPILKAVTQPSGYQHRFTLYTFPQMPQETSQGGNVQNLQAWTKAAKARAKVMAADNQRRQADLKRRLNWPSQTGTES